MADLFWTVTVQRALSLVIFAQAAHLVYNGYWFSPEMQFLQNALDHAQRPVTGSVDVRLHKVRCFLHLVASTPI